MEIMIGFIMGYIIGVAIGLITMRKDDRDGI